MYERFSSLRGLRGLSRPLSFVRALPVCSVSFPLRPKIFPAYVRAALAVLILHERAYYVLCSAVPLVET